MSSRSRDRNRVRQGVDKPSAPEYPRVGRRKDEDEDTFPWTILPSCRLCWVRFEHGLAVASCDCIAAMIEESNGA